MDGGESRTITQAGVMNVPKRLRRKISAQT